MKLKNHEYLRTPWLNYCYQLIWIGWILIVFTVSDKLFNEKTKRPNSLVFSQWLNNNYCFSIIRTLNKTSSKWILVSFFFLSCFVSTKERRKYGFKKYSIVIIIVYVSCCSDIRKLIQMLDQNIKILSSVEYSFSTKKDFF